MSNEAKPVERIIGTTSANQPASSPLLRLLRSSQHGLETIFRDHGVSPEAAEIVLREVLRTLVWKWETVRNREAWLLAVTDRRCASISTSPPQTPESLD